MSPLSALLQRGQDLNLRLARHSQAVVIVGFSRTAGSRPLARLGRFQLDLAGILVGDPAQVVDSTYTHAQRLIGLHREFIHRILETIDPDEVIPDVRHDAGNVIALASRRGR